MAHRRLRSRASVAAAALLLVVVPVGAASAAPTEDEVREARAAADAAAGSVASIEVELASLTAAQDAAWQTVQAAGEDYAAALELAEATRAAAEAAQARSAEADADREVARSELGTVAMGAHRSGGTMAQLGAMLDADGFEDLVQRSAALDRLGAQADRAVQRFTAADLAARTLLRLADVAATAAQNATAAAASALQVAEDAQADAEAQVAVAQQQRAVLVAELAALRGTAVAVEQARQDALEQQRQERAEAAAAAARGVERDGTPADDARADGAPDATPPAQGSEGSAPSRPADPPSRPADPPSGPADPPTGPADPPTRPADPPARPDPPAPDPPPSRPSPTPPPATTPPPKPPSDPYGLGTGSQRGSAAQGSAAVAWAVEQVGKPYVWGGTGPGGFDCSGLTSQAWRAAGVTINRTSRDQYTQVRKIRYADMRPGDLIFYGSDTSRPSSITHVAMFVGNGQMVEAPRPGVNLRVTAIRWSGTMPYAGRP